MHAEKHTVTETQRVEVNIITDTEDEKWGRDTEGDSGMDTARQIDTYSYWFRMKDREETVIPLSLENNITCCVLVPCFIIFHNSEITVGLQ